MNETDAQKWYRILDLSPGSELAEIKDSYRTLSQIWHPDKHEPGSKAYAKAAKKQQELNEAYECLVKWFEMRTKYGAIDGAKEKSASGAAQPPPPAPDVREEKAPPPPKPKPAAESEPAKKDLFDQNGTPKANALFDFLSAYLRICDLENYRPLGKKADTFNKPANASMAVLYLKICACALAFALGILVFLALPLIVSRQIFGEQGESLGFIAGFALFIFFVVNIMRPATNRLAVYEYLTDPSMYLYKCTRTQAEEAVQAGLAKYLYGNSAWALAKAQQVGDSYILPASISYKDASGQENRIDCRVQFFTASESRPVLVKVSFAADLPGSLAEAAKVLSGSLASVEVELRKVSVS